MVHPSRLAGVSVATVLAATALAPAAMAGTGSQDQPQVATVCAVSTSPLQSCGAFVSAPPGRIYLGQTIRMHVTGLKPASRLLVVVHHRTTLKPTASGFGLAAVSYKPTRLGMVVMSVSGKSKLGKGFGKTYRTLVIPRPTPKKHRGVAGKTARTASQPHAVVTTQLSSDRLHGVSLNAGDVTLLGVTLLAGAGCVTGLVVGGRRRQSA